MEYYKKRALIASFNTNYTKKEIFSFYHFVCKKNHRLYGKLLEVFPLQETDFYCFHAPLHKKMKEKHWKYLAQYIKYLCEDLKVCAVYYNWKGENIDFGTNDNKNQVNCVLHMDWFTILKKYAKLCRVPLKDSIITLICDNPQQTEPIINQICREVYQIRLLTKNASLFEKMNLHFFQNYGILLKAGETIGSENQENSLIISISSDMEFIQNCTEQIQKPILNISPHKYGIKNIYEDIIFSGNEEISFFVSKCGKFTGEVLLFLYFAFRENQNNTEFCKFCDKYGIKYIKLVKND